MDDTVSGLNRGRKLEISQHVENNKILSTRENNSPHFPRDRVTFSTAS